MAASQEWLKIEDSDIPQFTIANITNYFINRVTTDGKPANDFKSVTTRAYPLFRAGHIQSVYTRRSGSESYELKCKCLPEMRKDRVYDVELSMDASGDINTASCGCPAGAGPHGSCKHISALCYALEEYSRVKELRSPDSCTLKLQQ